MFRKVTHKADAAEDERQRVDDRALARAVRAHQHIVLAETQVGLLNAAEAAYGESEQLHRESVSAKGSLAFQNLDQLCDYLELSFVRAGEHDRLEVRVDGLEGDLLVAPSVAFLRLFALVTLDRVALTGLGIGGVAELDEDGLALTRALDRSAEEAPGTVGNRGLPWTCRQLGRRTCLCADDGGTRQRPTRSRHLRCAADR